MTATTVAPADTQERYDSGRFAGVIESLDRTGDTKIMWDSDNAQEIAVAKAAFDAHIALGGMAYRAEGKHGDRGTKLKKFDPQVERIVLVPQLVGG